MFAFARCDNCIEKRKWVKFHKFPKERSVPKLWVCMCEKADSSKPSNIDLCSDSISKSGGKRFAGDETSCCIHKGILRTTLIPLINTPMPSELNEEVEFIKSSIKRKEEEKEEHLKEIVTETKDYNDSVGMGSDSKDNGSTRAITVLQEKIIQNLKPVNENSIDYNMSLLVNCACFISDIHEKADNGEILDSCIEDLTEDRFEGNE